MLIFPTINNNTSMPGSISALVYMHLYCADVGPPGPVGAAGQKGLQLSNT